MIEKIEIPYTNGANHQAPSKHEAKIMVMIGSLAEHGIKVVVIKPIRRSLMLSMVLFAIKAGTPQPVAITIGMKLRPDIPKKRKILSRTNATRVM